MGETNIYVHRPPSQLRGTHLVTADPHRLGGSQLLSQGPTQKPIHIPSPTCRGVVGGWGLNQKDWVGSLLVRKGEECPIWMGWSTIHISTPADCCAERPLSALPGEPKFLPPSKAVIGSWWSLSFGEWKGLLLPTSSPGAETRARLGSVGKHVGFCAPPPQL